MEFKYVIWLLYTAIETVCLLVESINASDFICLHKRYEIGAYLIATTWSTRKVMTERSMEEITAAFLVFSLRYYSM